MAATFNDLTGRKFGEWTVLEHSHYESKTHWWRVRCSCGTERIQRGWVLTHGKSTRCGDCAAIVQRQQLIMRELTRLQDMDLGSWTVLRYAGSVPGRGVNISMWTCQCTCGAVLDLSRDSLGKASAAVCHHGVIPTEN